MKSILVLYELKQIPALSRFLSRMSVEERNSMTIIALGADIEFALEELHIPFESGRGLRTITHFEFSVLAEKMGREVLADPTFSFFAYRNVPLTTVFMPVLQVYLLSALYFIDVFTTLAKASPGLKRIILLPTAYTASDADSVLYSSGVTASPDAARIVGQQYDFEVFIPELDTEREQFRVRMKANMFNGKRLLFGWGLFFFNMVMTAAHPAKSIRILATDYWKHLSPLMDMLPEGELVLLDRSEVFNIRFIDLWKNRMRFMHIEDFIPRAMNTRASAIAYSFLEKGEQVEGANTALQSVTFLGYSLLPILLPAVHQLLKRGGEKAVRTIEGAYGLYEKMLPDVVLVRASFSLQIHFPILCYVAKQLGIPSIEMQHGILYLGPGTFIHKPAPEFIATYGPLTSAGFKKFGYTDETLLNVGSPRFDQYQTLREMTPDAHLKTKPFTIACIVPAVLPQSWSDSYEAQDYFANIAAAVANIPDVLVIFKLRPGAENEAFYRTTIAQKLGRIPYKIAHYEPLIDVFADSDAIIPIYSTTVLEGLISGRPVVYNGTLEMHGAISREFEEYQEAGALIMATTPLQLKEALESLARDPQRCARLVENADAFMKQNYSFDGGASRRLADNIRALKAKRARDVA